MTSITREWLEKTITEFENTRDDIPFGLDDDGAKILKALKQAAVAALRMLHDLSTRLCYPEPVFYGPE